MLPTGCNVAYETQDKVNSSEGIGVLREAQPQDRETVRRWRNHPQVRAVSFTSHEIGADEHAAWWDRVAADPARRLMIYTDDDDVPAGVVLYEGYDPAAAIVSWGFYLDIAGLEARGGTLSAWLSVQREALDYAFDVLGVDTLTGEVLEDNTVVRRANRRFGFEEGPPAEREVDGRTVRYRQITLRREARRTASKGRV